MSIARAIALGLSFALAACGPAGGGGGIAGPQVPTPTPAGPPAGGSPVVSWDVLAREPVANEAQVKHILISWKDLESAFRGQLDPRAAARTKADAEDTVRELRAQLAAGTDFDTLMAERSEDLASAATAAPIDVTPDAQLVIEFRQLSLRLNPGEIAVCQSDYGFHVIKRFA